MLPWRRCCVAMLQPLVKLGLRLAQFLLGLRMLHVHPARWPLQSLVQRLPPKVSSLMISCMRMQYLSWVTAIPRAMLLAMADYREWKTGQTDGLQVPSTHARNVYWTIALQRPHGLSPPQGLGVGSRGGLRSPDLAVNSRLLYQLSYSRIFRTVLLAT